MIKIDRKAVPKPKILREPFIRDLARERREFFADQREMRKQKRYFDDSRFAEVGHQLAADPLAELFHHKCAFCETPFESQPPQLHFFRPINEAIGEPENLPDGYWWLMTEWFNMYAGCSECTRNKGVFFPLSEGAKRGQPEEKEVALRKEKPLLIDPCHDEPTEFLGYNPETAEMFPVGNHQERGAATIEILGLNRPTLLEDRLKVLYEMKDRLSKASGYVGNGPVEDAFQHLLRQEEATQTFSGLRRALIREWLEMEDLVDSWIELYGAKPLGLRSGPSSEEMDEMYAAMEESHEEQEVKKATIIQLTDAVSCSLAINEISRTSSIERFEIANFKCIEALTIKQSAPAPFGPEDDLTSGQWTVLLGENGSGKSSILQSLALALMDHREIERLFGSGEVRADDLLRYGEDFGFVKVYLTHSSEPIGFTLTRVAGGSVKMFFLSKVSIDGPVIRGFGAVRITRSSKDPRSSQPSEERVQVENIFDPFRTLRDPEEFIKNLSDSQWEPTRLALGDLIALTGRELLKRENGKVFLESGGERQSYRDLSDGYRSILAMACDIIAGISENFSDFQHAPGIILLDELGNHLHPRWKMRIVNSLRRTFSSMQFIITTHEPLCLRGVREGETSIIQRDEHGSVTALSEGLPSPRSLRVDQLLTSQHFGLSSTIDPELDALFQRYYVLRAKPTRTPEEESRMTSLKSQLDHEGVFKPTLGYTRRDQLMYEILDDQLARETVAESQHQRDEIRAETKSLVANLWKNIIANKSHDQSR